jgi:hypothetical protein
MITIHTCVSLLIPVCLLIASQLRHPIKEALDKAKESRSASITKELFDEIFQLCFKEMVTHSFIKFKLLPEYEQYKKDMANCYNKVYTMCSSLFTVCSFV